MKTRFAKVALLCGLLAGCGVAASGAEAGGGMKVVCDGEVCRLVPADAADSPKASEPASAAATAADGSASLPDRIAQGVMGEREFLAFLSGAPARDAFDGKGFLLVLLLAVLGGLALNLTPCVLPMIPVNLIVIGASARRGLLYGLGQMAAFGVLGLLAAVGGVAFGTVQSSPWFNGGVAALFVFFALALAGAFPLDFTRLRKGLKGGAFLMGVVSAALAGACVAPVLASVLLLTARLYAEGRAVALTLPFAVGFGLALPWPFLGAGLKVLPKPGAWMRWVNRLFAVLLAGLAVHYGLLAARGAVGASAPDARDLTVGELKSSRLLAAPRTRPLLVFCHADWCHNCPAMARLMATSPAVRKALDGMDVVRLKIVRPDELAALRGFESVRGLPAFVLYLPRDGQ